MSSTKMQQKNQNALNVPTKNTSVDAVSTKNKENKMGGGGGGKRQNINKGGSRYQDVDRKRKTSSPKKVPNEVVASVPTAAANSAPNSKTDKATPTKHFVPHNNFVVYPQGGLDTIGSHQILLPVPGSNISRSFEHKHSSSYNNSPGYYSSNSFNSHQFNYGNHYQRYPNREGRAPKRIQI